MAAQAVKRACDACHRRKVKCDGINPCRNCSSAQLSCTYNAIPQKKGPKGSRAKVISELRETQRQTSLSAKVQNRINGIACPPAGSGLGPTPGLLTGELVKECAHFFFDHLYPQSPILERHQMEQQVLYMEQNRDAYCLMTSLCAYIMLQPGMSMPPGDPYNLDMVPGANIISSQLLLEETIRVRKGYDYLDAVTFNALVTNFFIFGCYFGQEMHDKAWFHLREATTMIHMVGMHKEDYYLQFDAPESARRRRLYWLFFVIERAYALQRQRPTTLQATINPPSLSDDPTDPQAHQLSNFLLLVDLYRPFDDTLTTSWSKTKGQMSSQYLNGLQKQLNDTIQSFVCQDGSGIHDVQANQQWLKNTLWQLTSSGAMNANNDGMSFQYPQHMARELLVSLASHLPVQADLLGPGLVEKLFESALGTMELLSLQPVSRDPFSVGPREHFNQVSSIVAMSRNGDHRFLPLLLNKVNEVLPRLANPMLQNAPENSAFATVDIFDGFGNAGMAQPPPNQMHFDYDRKFPVEDYDRKYNVDLTGGTPESASNSNHSGSPSSLHHAGSELSASFDGSSGGDYSHNLSSFNCPPIPDMAVQHHMGASVPANPMAQTLTHSHQISPQHVSPTHCGSLSFHHRNGSSPQHARSHAAGSVSMPRSLHTNFRPPAHAHGPDGYHQLQAQAHLQSLDDFNSLPSAGSDASSSLMAMSAISGEMDFVNVR